MKCMLCLSVCLSASLNVCVILICVCKCQCLTMCVCVSENGNRFQENLDFVTYHSILYSGCFKVGQKPFEDVLFRTFSVQIQWILFHIVDTLKSILSILLQVSISSTFIRTIFLYECCFGSFFQLRFGFGKKIRTKNSRVKH